MKSWGSRGSAPGQFNVPHNIATDGDGAICVADRSNRRIQVFDGEGNYQRSIVLNVPYDKKRYPVLATRPPAFPKKRSRGRCASPTRRRNTSRCPTRSTVGCTR